MYYLAKKKKDPLYKRTSMKRKSPNLVDKLDKIFSKYIRLRDSIGGTAFRCISCGQIKPIAQADCGHYFSRTHMATRFDEHNAHAECRSCNRFKADHLHGYRINIVQKIGETAFNTLEWKHRSVKHWTEFELKEMIKHYSLLVKQYQTRYNVK